MAKLPGAPDLGPAPGADPARPVGSFDASPFARGGQALAQGVETLGKGIAKAGEGAADYALDENRWDYAKAHADFLARKVDLDAQAKNDVNYGPDASGKALPQRYADSIAEIRQQSAGLIQSGPMRERFVSDVAPVVAQGQVHADAHARARENDASISYVTQQGDALMDRAVKAPDDETRRQLIDAHNQLVDGLVAKGAITQVHALQVKQAWAHQYATADLLARADTDPQGVINELRAKPGTGDAVVNRILGVEGSARNPRSSATGAGQFIDATWLDTVRRNRPDLAQGRSDADILALRADPGLGREMTAAYVKENTAYLARQNLPATPGNIYLAHFLGPAGAAAVLKADPGTPVADALAQVVGAKRAQQMIEANPSILNGKLAGSVAQWADAKMGGAAPGGGSIYDMLRPDVREQVLAHAQAALAKQAVNNTAAFDQRYADTRAQAFDTGSPGDKPLTQGDFVGRFGAELGTQKYRDYSADLAVAARLPEVSNMTGEEQQAFLANIYPKQGEAGYATRLALYDKAAAFVARQQDARAKDPAGYAIKNLPAVRDAWGKLSNVLTDPAASDDDRRAAARDYAAKAALEQTRIGIPVDVQRVVPEGYVEQFNKAVTGAADSEEPAKRVGLVAQVQREAALWGEHWPAVMRQLAPGTQPMARAIGAGADPTAMTRLLSLGKDENPAKLLKEQNETKAKDLNVALNEQMAPFLRSLVGRQKDRDYTGYFNLTERLAALYVRDGKSASDAAADAFKAMIGGRYEFKDTWRIPKSAGVSADDVQAGTVAARELIAQSSTEAGGNALKIKPAVNDIGLTDPRADSLSKFARDGTFVTANDNSGLNLVYGDKFVRTEDGKPLLLTWDELARRGGSPATRRGAAEQNAITGHVLP